MRRVLTLLVSFTFVCMLGCGRRYDERMTHTLGRMREAILAGRYDAFRREFLERFRSGETLARAAS